MTTTTTSNSVQTKAVYGFITVVQVPNLGHCGGLLLLSEIGRPAEFHCTAPVTENKAQKILYGKTFESFLYCDQIGLALVEKLKSQPAILLTDTPKLLPLNELIQSPVVLVENDEQHDNDHLSQSSEIDPLQRFSIGNQSFRAESLGAQPLEHARQLCENFALRLPLDEPFERICSAIQEAHSIAR